MSHIAYYRVSTNGQSIEAQKSALTHAKLIERDFMDEGVSGSIPAADRPGFAAMVDYVRPVGRAKSPTPGRVKIPHLLTV